MVGQTKLDSLVTDAVVHHAWSPKPFYQHGGTDQRVIDVAATQTPILCETNHSRFCRQPKVIIEKRC